MKLGQNKLEELIKLKKSSTSPMSKKLNDRYFLSSTYKISNVEIENIVNLLKNNICTFKEIVDIYRNLRNSSKMSSFRIFLQNQPLFKKLEKNKLCTQSDLEEVLNLTKVWPELESEIYDLASNNQLLSYMINQSMAEKIVETFNSRKSLFSGSSYLYLLLNNGLLNNGVLFRDSDNEVEREKRKEYVKLMLSKIDKGIDVNTFVENTYLLKFALKNCLLTDEQLIKFTKLAYSGNVEGRDKNFFDSIVLVDESSELKEEIEDLLTVHSALYKAGLSERERKELFSICEKSEKAKANLLHIIENNLENQYSFDQFKELLTKDDNKKKQKLNF